MRTHRGGPAHAIPSRFLPLALGLALALVPSSGAAGQAAPGLPAPAQALQAQAAQVQVAQAQVVPAQAVPAPRPGPGGSARFDIGVLYWSMNIAGQVAMRDGLEAEAAAINAAQRASGGPTVNLLPRVAGDGDAGIARQITQMRELVASRVDLIIVQPTDNAALAEPLREANAAGIPVVAYDQYISGGKLAAYRTSDNYMAGYFDGEYVAAGFPDDRELRVILVEYPHVSSTVERVDGFIDALVASRQRYRILASYQAVEPVEGARAGAAILRDFPDKGSVDVVFTVNDGGGLAVARALQAAGRAEIRHATIDGDPASVENIKAGRITVIDSAQFCGVLGAEAMRAGWAVLQGKTPPFHALVAVFPIAKETLSRYPGWMGPLPPDFQKPWPSAKPRWSGALRVLDR